MRENILSSSSAWKPDSSTDCREVKARIALSQCQSWPRHSLHRIVLYRIVARNKIYLIYSLNCLRYEFHISLNDVFMRDSFVTSRHVVEMKQTLKTFRRPNTQGKLYKMIFYDTLLHVHYIKNLKKN